MKTKIIIGLFIVFIINFACKNDNVKKSDNTNNIQNNFKTDIIDKNNSITNVFPKNMYVTKIPILNVWEKPGVLYYRSNLVIQVNNSELVFIYNEILKDIYWSEIEYNSIKGYVPSDYLVDNIEECVLINNEKMELYNGTYYYDHVNILFGILENQEDIGKNIKENFIEIKPNYLNNFLVYSHYLNINIIQKDVYPIPDNYNDIISVDRSGSIKPVYVEYYFIENGLVYRNTVYGYEENTKTKIDKKRFEIVYMKK